MGGVCEGEGRVWCGEWGGWDGVVSGVSVVWWGGVWVG